MPNLIDSAPPASDSDMQFPAPLGAAAPSPATVSRSGPIVDQPAPDILGTSWPSVGEIGRRFAMGARNVAEGVGGIVGGVGDVLTYPGRAIGRAIGYQPPPWQDFYTSPSQQIQQGLDALGLPSAQTPGEQLTATAVRGGTAMLPTLAGLPTAPPVPAATSVLSAVKPVLQGAAGAVAGQQAAKFPLVPPVLKPTVELLGNVAGGSVVNAGADLIARLNNLRLGNLTSLASAFDTLGITPRSTGAVTTAPSAQSIEATLAGVPGGKGPITGASRQMVDELDQAVNDTAANLNFQATGRQSIPSAADAGQTAQTAIRD